MDKSNSWDDQFILDKADQYVISSLIKENGGLSANIFHSADIPFDFASIDPNEVYIVYYNTFDSWVIIFDGSSCKFKVFSGKYSMHYHLDIWIDYYSSKMFLNR